MGFPPIAPGRTAVAGTGGGGDTGPDHPAAQDRTCGGGTGGLSGAAPRGVPPGRHTVFGIGLREFILIAFVLVLVFGLKFWVRVGMRLASWVRRRFKVD